MTYVPKTVWRGGIVPPMHVVKRAIGKGHLKLNTLAIIKRIPGSTAASIGRELDRTASNINKALARLEHDKLIYRVQMDRNGPQGPKQINYYYAMGVTP